MSKRFSGDGSLPLCLVLYCQYMMSEMRPTEYEAIRIAMPVSVRIMSANEDGVAYRELSKHSPFHCHSSRTSFVTHSERPCTWPTNQQS